MTSALFHGQLVVYCCCCCCCWNLQYLFSVFVSQSRFVYISQCSIVCDSLSTPTVVNYNENTIGFLWEASARSRDVDCQAPRDFCRRSLPTESCLC